MFERVEHVNIDVTGRLKDWIKYAQDSPIWKELIQHECMLDPQRKLPARPNWESGDSSNASANSQSNQSDQRQEQSRPRRERTQADDRHLEHAEMKNPPIDNRTQTE